MIYNDKTLQQAHYAAKFRQEGKQENKNGQNVVSHTSLLEQGRCASKVREYAEAFSDSREDK